MTLPRYEPMLATRGPRDLGGPEWGFELKWDGARAMLYWDGERVELVSRRGNDVTPGYPELAVFRHERPCILDGEIIAFDPAGRPSFERLQARLGLRYPAAARAAAREVPVAYVAYDVLYVGEPVIDHPLTRRRDLLDELRLREPFTASDLYDDGESLWAFVEEQHFEGMVAKRLGARYQPGVRSPDWRKVPHYQRLNAVVGGFTPGEGGRTATFGSLAVGLMTPQGLRWVGTVGSGFTDPQLVDIRAALDQMRIGESPFLPDPDLPVGWSWVEPRLVAVVQYKEMTRVGRLRAPVFLGFSGEPPGSATWADQVGVREI